MNSANSQVLPAPPNIIRTLLTGFDAVSNHIYLILFSFLFDLFLWFSPRIRVLELLRGYFDQSIGAGSYPSPQVGELIQDGRETILGAIELFNLTSALRAYPIGVPSLMANRPAIANPMGPLIVWEVPSFAGSLLIWLIIGLVGVGLGTLYFSFIAETVLKGKINWKAALRKFPNQFLQTIFLSIFLLVMLIGVIVPISCVLPFLLSGGNTLVRISIFIYIAFIFWLLFPLIYSPLGIFVYDDKIGKSISRGSRLVRRTAPISLLFILALFVLNQGLDVLWSIPSETSWFTLVGILGHAFIATGSLAALFIFYRDLNLYVQRLEGLLSK